LCRPDDVGSGDVLGQNFRMVPETAPPYSIAEQFKIPLSLAREGVRLVHEPHYVLPPLVRCKSVVTIHDCIHLMFPQYLPNRLSLAYARTSISLAARRATRVLTVSELAHSVLQRPAGEVVVIHNAIDERFVARESQAHGSRASDTSSITRSCCMSATSSRTRTSAADQRSGGRGLGPGQPETIIIGDEISNPALRQSVHKHKLDKHVRFLISAEKRWRRSSLCVFVFRRL
jgi:hypothetical protein